MRFVLGAAGLALGVLALAGCPTDDSGTGSYYNPGDPGSVPGCQTDTDCASSGSASECARDGECLAPSEIRAVKVTWTVRGQTADAASCADSPDLFVEFDGQEYGDSFGYAPVPCVAGEFPVDKLPTHYIQADLGVNNTNRQQSAAIDPSTGLAAIDLQP